MTLQFPSPRRPHLMTLAQAMEIERAIQAFPENVVYAPDAMRLAVGSYRLVLEALRRVDPANPLLQAAQA